MLIRASSTTDYTFSMSLSDYIDIPESFLSGLLLKNDYYTPLFYSELGLVTIKNKEYFGVIANKTRTFETTTALLASLGLTYSVTSKIPIVNPQSIFEPITTNFGSVFHEIPQVNAITRLGKIIGVYGEYSLNTNIFTGIVEYE